MDPRDPRLAQHPVPGDEPPQWQRDQREQEQQGEHRPLVQIGPEPRAADDLWQPDLTERYGPRAPVPQWDVKPEKPFNRERFLLYLVGWIIGVHFSLFILVGLMCSYKFFVKTTKITSAAEQFTACPNVAEQLERSVNNGLAVLLALLGGGAVAVNEYSRRHPPDPRSPR